MQFKNMQLFKILFWIALIGSYVAAIVPQEVAPHIGSLSDKGIHFIAFAVLTVLFSIAYRIVWIRTSLWLLSYAVFIEVSQLFTPNRSAEVLDVVADVIGIMIGLLSVFLIRNYIPGFKTDEKH